MIRRAGPEDIEHVFGLIKRFHAASWWPDETFDEPSTRRFAQRLLTDHAVFLSRDGLSGICKTVPHFNDQLSIVAELVFWAPDGRGDELRRAAEEYSRGHLLMMNAHRSDERVGRWYRRKGYQPIETTYVRAC